MELENIKFYAYQQDRYQKDNFNYQTAAYGEGHSEAHNLYSKAAIEEEIIDKWNL
jgi:hypothetical protein